MSSKIVSYPLLLLKLIYFCIANIKFPAIFYKKSHDTSISRLDSTGLLADSEQSHLIGTYEYVSEGPDGRLNYRQKENFQKYLYYYTGFGFNVSLRKTRINIQAEPSGFVDIKSKVPF